MKKFISSLLVCSMFTLSGIVVLADDKDVLATMSGDVIITTGGAIVTNDDQGASEQAKKTDAQQADSGNKQDSKTTDTEPDAADVADQNLEKSKSLLEAVKAKFSGKDGQETAARNTDDGTDLPEEEDPQTPPTAQNMSIEVTKNTKMEGKLLAEGTDLVFATVESAKNGTVKILDNKEGYFEYTPNTDYLGEDSFKFNVYQGDVSSEPATVSITVVEPPPPEPQSIYTDMDGHWAQSAADLLYERDFVQGETVENQRFFYPDYVMNRLQFVVWANAVFGNTTRTQADTPFTDLVDADAWIKLAAKKAYDSGLVKGSLENGGLYFNPNSSLTRMEAITMLHNVINPSPTKEAGLDFTDYDSIPIWGRQIVKDMINIGIVKGYDDGSFKPDAVIQRDEAANLLQKTMTYLENNSDSKKRAILK